MTARILIGDCRPVLRTLPDKSVNTVCTSPPYWGLRDYKIPPSVWGGDLACEHGWNDVVDDSLARRGTTPGLIDGGRAQIDEGRFVKISAFCRHCGAWRGCFGLEPTYQLYVEHLVEIFDEIWRVLRDDGTLWLNLGDCYATAPSGWSAEKYWDEELDNRTFRDKPFSTITRGGTKSKRPAMGKHEYIGAGIGNGQTSNRTPQPGLKPKDMAGIPWRVAFALQDRGWYLRRDIIWHKQNPMPESVYDRPTTSHEYIFLFSKSGDTLLWRHQDGRWVHERPEADWMWRHRKTRETRRHAPKRHKKQWVKINLWRGFDYYYDFAAIMEPSSPDSHARSARSRSDTHKYAADGGPGGKPQGIAIGPPVAGRVPFPAGWDEGAGRHGTVHRDGRRPAVADGKRVLPANWKQGGVNSGFFKDRVPKGRKLADYGTGRGTTPKQNDRFDAAIGSGELVAWRNKRSVWSIATKPFKGAHFATFPPDLIRPCILAGCPKHGVVLDPFAGAGTTGAVALEEDRNAILIEINATYAAMARERLGLFVIVEDVASRVTPPPAKAPAEERVA